LEKDKILGEGAFSKVLKVQNSGKIYALKSIDLSKISPQDIKNLNQEIILH